MRNVAILEAVLSGKDYAACAKIFNISLISVSNNIRMTIRLLKEHTDIDMLESSSYSYILEKRDEIKKFLFSPFPKTTITPAAKTYLQNKFGKYYARDPGKIAAVWPDISNAFNRYTERRHTLSIQNWLALEGYMVGNVLTSAMLDFTWEALQKELNGIKADKGDYSLLIKKVERTGWKSKLVMQIEIKEKDHQATRQFSIDLVPG
jgi:hypothetical protein